MVKYFGQKALFQALLQVGLKGSQFTGSEVYPPMVLTQWNQLVS